MTEFAAMIGMAQARVNVCAEATDAAEAAFKAEPTEANGEAFDRAQAAYMRAQMSLNAIARGR